MGADRVAQLLADISLLDPGRCALVQALREIILGLDACITEEVKYGGFLFSVGKPFCGVFCYAKHVSLEFSEGATLADHFNVLAGDGKWRRHIKLSSTADIAGKHVRDYLALALKLAKS